MKRTGKKQSQKKPMNAVIGERVRAYRKKAALSTTALAKQMGITQAQVSRLENGLQGWRMVQLVKAADVFQVPVPLLVIPQNVREMTFTFTNDTSKVYALPEVE